MALRELHLVVAITFALVEAFATSTQAQTRNVLSFAEDTGVTIPNAKYDGARPITVEAFVKPTGQEKRRRTVLANFEFSGFGLELSQNRWSFGVYDKDGCKYAVSNETAEVNKPVHLAGVYDGTKVQLYVDGVLQNVAPATVGPHRASKRAFMVGANPSGRDTPGNSFTGDIWDVRVSATVRYRKNFNVPAKLTADQVSVLFLPFDEGNGEVVQDKSGHGFTGTILGAKWTKRTP